MDFKKSGGLKLINKTNTELAYQIFFDESYLINNKNACIKPKTIQGQHGAVKTQHSKNYAFLKKPEKVREKSNAR